jgi:hypothetical protein
MQATATSGSGEAAREVFLAVAISSIPHETCQLFLANVSCISQNTVGRAPWNEK